MVYDGIIIGIVVGFFRGGWQLEGIRRLGQLRLKAGWVFPLLLLVQLVIFYLQGKFALLASMNGILFMAVYVTGMIFLWLNRHHPGFTLILIGVLLNFLAMAVNGGRMPVSLTASTILGPYYMELLSSGEVISKHVMMDTSTRLPFLGDIIPLSSPYPRTQVISIGDVIMNLGIFFLIQHLMVPKKKGYSSANPHHA